MEDYEADNHDRKRRKESIIEAREDIAKITIEAAEAIKRGGSTSSFSVTEKKTTKKKKGSRKVVTSSVPSGPREVDPAMEALAREESEEEYDSIDEEEEYYQENVVGVTRERISLKKTGGNEDEEDGEDEEEDDEDDDTLLLRDIVRPLEAWNFHLNGKEAIETDEDYDGFVENNQDIQDGGSSKTNNTSVSTAAHKEQIAEEKGRFDNDNMLGAFMNGTEESKQQSNEKKQGDAPTNGNKNGAAKITSASSSTSNPPSTS
jgi:hypothetical protein